VRGPWCGLVQSFYGYPVVNATHDPVAGGMDDGTVHDGDGSHGDEAVLEDEGEKKGRGQTHNTSVDITVVHFFCSTRIST